MYGFPMINSQPIKIICIGLAAQGGVFTVAVNGWWMSCPGGTIVQVKTSTGFEESVMAWARCVSGGLEVYMHELLEKQTDLRIQM